MTTKIAKCRMVMEEQESNNSVKENLLELENETGLNVDTIEDCMSENISNVYPDAHVKVEKAQFSVSHVKTLHTNRQKLIINPDFQRNDVWKMSQKCDLVESILMGIPIPIIYLFEDKRGNWIVVDGKQRITALLEFIDGKFSLQHLKILSQFNGKKFSDLDLKMQGIFEDYQLFFYIIQPPTPERVKYDIFDRVNRKGTQLNSQEMRNALYYGKSTKLLEELSKSTAFINATDNGISAVRMRDKYVILRSLSFYLWRKCYNDITMMNEGRSIDYKSDIDDFLAKMMVFINENATDDLINKCHDVFLLSMSQCYEIMGKDAFRFSQSSDGGKKRPVNMVLFEVLMFLFAEIDIDIDIAKNKVEEFKIELDKYLNTHGNLDSTLNVLHRYERIENLMDEIKL